MLTLLALAACKGHGSPPDPAPGAPGAGASAGASAAIDAAGPDANLDTCRAALAGIAVLPPTDRAQALLDACHPCGDWAPLIDWNTPLAQGGPPFAAIEQALAVCAAYCEPSVKRLLLDTLDAARGQPTRTPWRRLGEACKAKVSAVPDARFMSAPYFALDRIARAIGGAPGAGDLTIPLPALGVTGLGVELPSVPGAATGVANGAVNGAVNGAAPKLTHDAGPVALTVDAIQILLGALPSATLSATGLAVTGDYPGAALAPAALAAELARRTTADHPAAVLAPHALHATRVAEVVAAAGGHPVRLAVAVPGPRGWSAAGTLPIALVAAPAPRGTTLQLGAVPDAALAALHAVPATARIPSFTIAIDPAATVDGLTAVLAALVVRGATEVALTAPVTLRTTAPGSAAPSATTPGTTTPGHAKSPSTAP
ncbi:MAG TPA: hypothetical protein VH165_15310 [Kofleriaceae bacterium]|nr:hypothetical protein [Kofleriaceae bacterium]